MKLHEQIFDVLGEIDDDLLPDMNKQPRCTNKRDRILRWTAAAAAVCLLAGGGILFCRRLSSAVRIPVTVYASDIVPHYLLKGYPESIVPGDPSLTLAPLTGISLQPQIFSAESADAIILPDNLVFADTERDVWRLFANDSAPDDSLEKNLRVDVRYANYLRDYGCVVWKIDRTTEPASVTYLGIVPLTDRDEAVRRFLDGQYITTVPESELPEDGITEDRIERRELVYLIPKHDDLIRIYECFFVRLDADDPADSESRWGLFYVPATDDDAVEKLTEQTLN
jgi:hypothetical protein